MAEKKTETIEAATFTKAQILDSKKYANRRDALSVILNDKENYTLENVDALLDNFMKGKVN